MDICLFKSTFVDNVATKSATTSHVKQPTAMQADNVPLTNTGKTVTTYNSLLIGQKQPATESLKNFNHTLDKKISNKTSRNAQPNQPNKRKKRDQSSGTLSNKLSNEAIHPAEPLMLQERLTRPVVLDKTANAKLLNQFQQKIETHQGKTIRLINDSNSSLQTSSLITQPVKTITNSPDQIVSTTAKPENKSIRPTIDQSQIKSEIILPSIPNKSLFSNAQFEKDKDTGKMQVPDKAFVAKEKLVNQENAKELLQELPLSNSKTITASKKLIVTDKPLVPESPKTLETNKAATTSKAITDRKSSQEIVSETLPGDSKITIAGEKPLTMNKSIVASSRLHTFDKPITTTKTLTYRDGGKDLMPETHTGGKPVVTNELSVLSGAETTVATKPVMTSTVPSNQQSGKESTPKTVISNSKTTADTEQSVVTNKPFASDEHSSHAQQKVLIGQEIPTQAGEKTTPNKADTDQKDHRGETELLESPEKNRVLIENPSVKSIAHKMNQPLVELSAQKAENHNNLLSNQAPKPDMELYEQEFTGRNVQLGITEQSPASPTSGAFIKNAGNVDSGDSVGEQIQESIHSSFLRGNQQIIIRLNPPELGKVAIKFTEQGNDITGLLQVDKPQTRDQIQQALPEIVQNLQNCGIGIKRLDVVLTNQQEQYTSKDQSSTAGQDSWSEQQSSPNPDSQRNNTTYNEWLTSIDNDMEFNEAQMQFAGSSINMLI